MNIATLGMENINLSIGNRLAVLIGKLSDRVIALQAAAGKSSSQEKIKREAKEKASSKKPSTPKSSKPKTPQSKPPKKKVTKPRISKPKVEKQEEQAVLARVSEEPILTNDTEIRIPEKQVDSNLIKEKINEIPKEDVPFIIPRETSKTERPAARSTAYTSASMTAAARRKNNERMLRMGGVILLLLVVVGMGLRYLLNNRPAAVVPTSIPNDTTTGNLPTATSVPFTPTAVPLPTETAAPTETPVSAPALGIGSLIAGNDGMNLVYVPEGEFTMGSDVNPDEQPVHKVTLDAFWIDQTEVTNAMYLKCVEADQCRPPVAVTSNTRSSYFYNPKFGNYPVVYVSWSDANAYCSWVGRRLPTEAEWEKAARGTDGSVYPWGNDEPNDSLISIDALDTSQVAQYPAGASFYGAFDMAGNVWEWVADWYDDSYYQDSPSLNPLGPDSGSFRVLRGGSWFHLDGSDRSAERYQNGLRFNNALVGFRCSMNP